jgi:phosphoserine phosphatase RsbU/P
MKCPRGKDSLAALGVASYDRSSNSVPSIPSSSDLEKDSASLHRDLAIAKEVQKASFPQRAPAIPGLNFASFYKPALCVGGDYYDVLGFRDGAWGIAIGDVSGKGSGAALVLANLQASFRAQTLQPRSDLETLMANVNRLVWESSPRHFFASLFYAEYEVETRELQYVNAGHYAPMLLRWKHNQCKIFYLESSGAPLGLFESSQFASKAFQLEEGDVFVAYTDGITESEDSCGELWGHERLETLLRTRSDSTPEQIVGRIIEEVFAFAKECSQGDDMTLLVVGVKDET